MKYFLDTEFHEYKKKGIDTIELISIGLVADNAREYYAVCKDFDLKATWKNEWLRENVLKSIFFDLSWQDFHYSHYKDTWLSDDKKEARVLFLYDTSLCDNQKWFKRLIKQYGKSRAEIAQEIKCFAANVPVEQSEGTPEAAMEYNKPKFYGYYADYDWVVFCWLFGRMIDLPKGFPMYCIDLKQMMDEKGLDKEWKRENCPDPEGEHNALVDARWNFELYEKILTI